MRVSTSQCGALCLAIMAALCPSLALAQVASQVVPLLTEQTPLPLSNQFGIPHASVVNDAGDYAFIGHLNTAVFYRGHMEQTARRVVQVGDDVAGIANSRVFQFAALLMNPAGVIAISAQVATPAGLTGALLTFDGTTLTVVAAGSDVAPGTGGATFEVMSLLAFNASGDMLLSSPLVPVGSTAPQVPTLFFIPSGGAAQRIAGVGDAAPGTGGTFSSLTGLGLNSSGDVLFSAAVASGSGASGLFAWNAGTLRKVVAQGDATHLGGTFGAFTGADARLNNQRDVAFVVNSSLWVNSFHSGNYPIENFAVVQTGTAAPAPVGGTLAIPSLRVFNDSGHVAFESTVSGGAAASGLFRYRPGTPSALDVVSYRNQPAPGVPGQQIASWNGVSMNSAGVISFSAGAAALPMVGVYQQAPASPLALVVAEGTAVPTGGAILLTVLKSTDTLADGTVVVRTDVTDAPADYAEFLWTSPIPRVLMTTTDELPPGARTSVRNFRLSGDFVSVGFFAQRAGGRRSQGSVSIIGQAFIHITDGDVVASAGGRRFRQAATTAVANAYGQSVLHGTFIGGPITRRGILLSSYPAAPVKVAMEGELDAHGRVLTQINATSMYINSSAQITFEAFVNSSFEWNVFVASQFGPPEKVAAHGDAVSTGGTITSISNFYAGPNATGQVVIRATVGGVVGLYLGRAGDVPEKVVAVGDAAPGGGTFSGFASFPDLNSAGDVVFEASVTGGAGGGVFVKAGGLPVEAIALHGGAAPGGGAFALTTPRSDVVINDNGDVVFQSDLTGGTADSGYFKRRNFSDPFTQLEVVARQGDPAPATAGTFATFAHSTRARELVQVSLLGDVAFNGAVSLPGGLVTVPGVWHSESAAVSQPIVATGAVAPALGGGVAARRSTTSTWMGFDRYPFYAMFPTGTFREGIFLYVTEFTSQGAGTTGIGNNVAVTPENHVAGSAPLTATFQTVTGAGTTTVASSSAGPPLPREYASLSPPAFFNITTTATFTGTVTVCLDFSNSGYPQGAVLRVLHFENSAWLDVTSSAPDVTIICGTVSSLSPFAVAQALNEPTSNILQNGNFSGGAANWLQFASRIDQSGTTIPDVSYISWAVTSGVFEYYRIGPTAPDIATSAVVLQNTAVPFSAGDPIVAHFDLGNSSSTRKRISVLIHHSGFQDLSVCTFFVPPNTPLRTYAMRTHTTVNWPGASISFYAASAGANGGVYQLDNVVMGPGSTVSARRTDCVDPFEPGIDDAPDGPPLVTNGDFSNGLTGWSAVYTITTQVTGGVAQFVRPATTVPSGVLLHRTFQPVPAGKIVNATFRLGNSSNARKRITILLHDFFFADLTACTFWLPAHQPLSTYTMRTYTTAPWNDATIAFYPATTDNLGWYELDNVALSVTPAASTYGTDCVEPGDTSGLAPAPEPAPQPAGLPTWAGLIAVDRRWTA